jgi:hypothetical protein
VNGLREKTMYSTRSSASVAPLEFETLQEAEQEAAKLSQSYDVQIVKVSVIATYRRRGREG